MPRARSSPRRPTRAETKVATREALIRAAIDLIARDGLDAPSLDDICERAGYTRGAFYVHFADRDQLLRAAMESIGGRVLDLLLGASGEERLAVIADRFVGALKSGGYPLTRAGGVRPYQLLDACARSAPIRRQYVRLLTQSVERLGALVQGDIARGEVRSDVAPETVAWILVALVIGLQTLLDLEVPLAARTATRAVLRLLAPPTPTKRRR